MPNQQFHNHLRQLSDDCNNLVSALESYSFKHPDTPSLSSEPSPQVATSPATVHTPYPVHTPTSQTSPRPHGFAHTSPDSTNNGDQLRRSLHHSRNGSWNTGVSPGPGLTHSSGAALAFPVPAHEGTMMLTDQNGPQFLAFVQQAKGPNRHLARDNHSSSGSNNAFIDLLIFIQQHTVAWVWDVHGKQIMQQRSWAGVQCYIISNCSRQT